MKNLYYIDNPQFKTSRTGNQSIQTGCTYGETNRIMIEGLQRRTNNLERKINWVFYTLVTTLVTVIVNLVTLIGAM